MNPLFPQQSEPQNDAKFEGKRSATPIPFVDPEIRRDWEFIKTEMRNRLSSQAFQTWIQPIQVRASENQDELILVVPDMVFYHGLINNHYEVLERCKTKLGFDHLSIKIDLIKDCEVFLEADPGKPEALVRTEIEIEHNNDAEKIEISEQELSVLPQTLLKTSKFNPNYTFSTFVRGPSNQFALATCHNIAENPGTNYNPLFLYGSTGLGKTHLLHAVGNYILSSNPNAIVTYISSERFMNEMIYCIRHNKMWEFRQKYRHCDVFMMDDIQFISGNKSTTQEEFFHTFNTLYDAKKQIIITSDLFPQDIPDIEERLRNRFQWGLIADIQPPDMEHRVAILFTKAEKMGIHIAEDVAEYIATHIKRNVRELEGTLHRLVAFAALQGRQLNITLAREILHNMTQPEGTQQRLSIEHIQKTVAEHFKIKISDLKSQKRQRTLALARQIAMYLARNFTNSSFPEIGGKFGGKDHTTVIHAVKRISSRKITDTDLKNHVESIERQLEQLSLLFYR
ncbi:MAG: chromosomal replication initiator protein DnaA [Oligoflexales bacterium]|nr:chromosomal replication initiator protein DnaA [Oligoflexales bacterium]